MGITLFILFVFLGGITWPLFYAVLDVLIFAVKGLCRMASEAGNKAKERKIEEPEPDPPAFEEPARNEQKDLSYEKKVMFCSNIIDDSYSYKDEILDEILEGNKTPVFSVPDCLDCSDEEYRAQFGKKKWEDAWADALSLAFGIKFSSLGKGCFVGENSQ